MIDSIKRLFPNADPLVDFELRDNSDGNGPFIARWDIAKLGPQPTVLQLVGVAAVANLAAAKTKKLASLEASRKQAIDNLAPITVAGKQFPATTEYREVITGITRRQAAERPVPGTLRGADGVPVTLTPVLIGQIDDAIASSVQTQWDKYWNRFDAVQAAATVADITGVVW